MQAMANMQGNLAAIAKEIDTAQKKQAKLRDKGSKAKASSVAEAVQDMEKAELQWDTQAPYVFEQLQAIDETRLNHLRDVLTQFQTHEVDQVERSRTTAEETLNAMLNIETADEIQTWALRMRSGEAPPPLRKMSNTPANLAPPPLPTSPTAADDNRSQKSGSAQEKHSSNPLKRFGTVLGRRKSAHPYGRATSPDRKSSANLGSAFSGFGKGKAKKNEEPALSSTAERPTSPLKRLSQQASQTSESPSLTRQASPEPAANGTIPESTLEMEEEAEEPRAVNGTSSAPEPIPEVDESAPPVPTKETQTEPAKDAEGYSMRPSAMDAITEAEREAGFAQPEGSAPPQFKLDIRNAPIQEEDGDADAATANLVNTLRAQAAQPKRATTLRGRRDVRNTIFVPSPATPELQSIGEVPLPLSSDSGPASGAASPPALPPQPSSPASKPHRALLSEDHAASDTQSIRSGRSLSSSASSTVKHPDLHEPGLNASLVETVSAWFEQGNVTKAMVIGQVALAYNPVDISAGPFGTESIRLENFPVLEKVAPNPAFIEQTPENPGSYTVDLSKITKTSVAFHYQLHVEESNVGSLPPIILSPAWKPEPTQTSVILHYSLNPKFDLGTATSITMRNLVLVIRLEPGSKATSCQSKPAGTFSRDKSLIYWRLGDVTLAKDSVAQTLRARFLTDGQANPGNTEARWEISDEHSLALGSGLGVSMSQSLSTKKDDAEDDPFADIDENAPPSPAIEWKPVNTVKKMISGTYLGV
ncbi:Suppressor of Profilin deletion [Exserohilum turcicum]